MTLKSYLIQLGATGYNCDGYGQNAYGECAAGTSTPGASPGGGGLADTGYDIIIPFAIGLSIVVASAILLVKRLVRAQRASAQK